MSMLKSGRRELIVSGAVYCGLGLLMCIWPEGTAGAMCRIAGVLLAAGGLMRIVGYFRKKESGLTARAEFSVAAIGAVVGGMMAVRPEGFLPLVPFMMGVLIWVSSAFQLMTARELKKMHYGGWWYFLAAALICGAAAGLMMFDPFGSYRSVAYVMGGAFIADGAMDLYTALYLKGKLKKLGLMQDGEGVKEK